jgi:hypothetical protein
MRQA